MTKTPTTSSPSIDMEDLRFAYGLLACRPWKHEPLERLNTDQRDALEEFVLLSPTSQSSIFIHLADQYLEQLEGDDTETPAVPDESLRSLLSLLEEHGDKSIFNLPPGLVLEETVQNVTDATPFIDAIIHQDVKEPKDWTLPALVGLVGIALVAGVFATISRAIRH